MDRPDDTVPYIERTRRLYASQRPYRWVVHDPAGEPPPWAPISKALSEMRIVLIASGGVYRDDQEPFHFRNDTSHREVPIATEPGRLRVSHFGYDIRDAQRDTGRVFPLRALRELAAAGVVGGLVETAISFMGGIYSSRRVREELAPRLRDFVLRERADLAYLVPA